MHIYRPWLNQWNGSEKNEIEFCIKYEQNCLKVTQNMKFLAIVWLRILSTKENFKFEPFQIECIASLVFFIE